jgi:hypothetical protein
VVAGLSRLTARSEPRTCSTGKSEAVARGRELAENKQAEFVIKNEKGRIEAKDSHGNDPRKIKG